MMRKIDSGNAEERFCSRAGEISCGREFKTRGDAMIKSGKVHELSAAKGQRKTGGILLKRITMKDEEILLKKHEPGKPIRVEGLKPEALLDFNLTLSRSFHDFLFLWESDPQDSVEHYRRYFFALHLLGKYKTSPVRCV